MRKGITQTGSMVRCAAQQPAGQAAPAGAFPHSPRVPHVGPHMGRGGTSTPLLAGDVVKSRFLGFKSGHRSLDEFGMFLPRGEEASPRASPC